jgi:hypothetical protein
MTSGNGLDAPTHGALVVSVEGVDTAPNLMDIRGLEVGYFPSNRTRRYVPWFLQMDQTAG